MRPQSAGKEFNGMAGAFSAMFTPFTPNNTVNEEAIFHLIEYGIREGVERVGQRIEARGQKIGEHADLDRKEIDEILALCAE